jgi:AraC-like DNA-binding protein
MEDLGLRIGQHLTGRLPGMLGERVGQASTLREALGTFYRLTPHHNSGVRAWSTTDGAQVRLHHVFLHGGEDDWGQFAASVLMQYLKLIESVAGPDWRPTSIRVPIRSLPGRRAIRLLSETPIELGQAAMTIIVSAALLDRPLPSRPPGRAGGTAEDWDRAKPAHDFGGAVQQIVAALLPTGYPDVRVVAEVVRMSPRTLQRRLRDEGLTFAGVVARTRCEVARHLLVDPDRKVIDVALDLGYSDPAHFTRAFTRWTGLPPRDFRRHAAEHA